MNEWKKNENNNEHKIADPLNQENELEKAMFEPLSIFI